MIDLMREQAQRPMTYLDNGKKVTTTTISAITHRLYVEALRGKVSAAKLITDCLSEGDRLDLIRHERLLDAMTKYQYEWSQIPNRPRNLIPNPDHLHVDHSGQVRCFGPFYAHEKRIQDQWQHALQTIQEEIDVLFAQLKSKRIGDKRRQALLKEYSEKLAIAEQLRHELRPDRDWMEEPPKPMIK